MRALKQQLAFFLINLIALRWLISLLPWAESSIFWSTGTTGDGATTYTESQLTTFFGDTFAPNSTITSPSTSGVLSHAGGELAVTGTSSPVSVASGAAIAEGYGYRSTAAVTVAIPTPASATRIDRIVLRVSHSTTRTVRVTRIAGTEGSGAAPAVTTTAGTTWDIKLAQVSITTGGVITVTDERPFCHFATRVDKGDVDGMIAGSVAFAGSSGRLTENGAFFWDNTNARLGIGTGTPSGKLEIAGDVHVLSTGNNPRVLLGDGAGAGDFGYVQWNSTADEIRIGTQAGGDSIKVSEAGQVTLNPAAANPPIVLGANAQGQKVVSFNADQIDGLDLAFGRQGGSASLWSTPGTNNYAPTALRRQVGVISFSGSYSAGSSYNLGTVTFPTAFSNTPVVVCSSLDFGVGVVISVGNVTASTVAFYLYPIAPVGSVTINWIAEGPA